MSDALDAVEDCPDGINPSLEDPRFAYDELGAEVDRLATALYYCQIEVEQLRAERDAWRDRAEALEKLLVCYRIGSRPSEKLHIELERTIRVLSVLEHIEGAR